MADSLIPTFALRLAMLPRPVPGHDASVSRFEPVLQQRFVRPKGGHLWKDVPVVQNEHLPDAAQDAVGEGT